MNKRGTVGMRLYNVFRRQKGGSWENDKNLSTLRIGCQ